MFVVLDSSKLDVECSCEVEGYCPSTERNVPTLSDRIQCSAREPGWNINHSFLHRTIADDLRPLSAQLYFPVTRDDHAKMA